jgi:broad specificity phosphatase PhoE
MRRLRTALWILTLVVSLRGSALAQRAVLVVRHAEKISDTDERLSDDGLSRAARLAALLKDSDVSAIYSPDTPRTRGTAQPLAEARKLPIQIYDSSGEDAGASALAARLRARHSDGVVLVVGHSNTVPALLRALGCPESISIASGEYDNLFVVVPRGRDATLVRLRY